MVPGKQQFEKFWKEWKGAAEPVSAADGAPPPETPPNREEMISQLRQHWKQIVAQVKADHSIQLAAALQSVRGIGASSAALTLYFGNNDYARGKCEGQARYLAEVMGEALQMPTLTLICALGDKPAA